MLCWLKEPDRHFRKQCKKKNLIVEYVYRRNLFSVLEKSVKRTGIIGSPTTELPYEWKGVLEETVKGSGCADLFMFISGVRFVLFR